MGVDRAACSRAAELLRASKPRGGRDETLCRMQKVLADARKIAPIFLLALAVIGFLAPAAMAQQVAVSQLDGYVTDPSGQAIVGAQVRVIEVDRDQVHMATTDVTGRYQLTSLPAGQYRLEVYVSGFQGLRPEGHPDGCRQQPDPARHAGSRRRDREHSGHCQRRHGGNQGKLHRAGGRPATNDRSAAQWAQSGRPAEGLRLCHVHHDPQWRRPDRQQEHPGVQRFGPIFGGRQRGQWRQLPAGRRRQQRRLQQREPAHSVPGCGPGIQRANQRFAGPIRIASRRRGQHRDQVRRQLLPRRPVRFPAQRRPQRAAERRDRAAAGARLAQAQPVRRHGRRQDHQGQAVLLWRLSGHAAAQRSGPKHRLCPHRGGADGRLQRAGRRQGQRRLPGCGKNPEGPQRQPVSRQPDSRFHVRSGGIEAGLHLYPDFSESLRELPLRLPGQQPRRSVDRPRRLQHQQQAFLLRPLLYLRLTWPSRSSTATTP